MTSDLMTLALPTAAEAPGTVTPGLVSLVPLEAAQTQLLAEAYLSAYPRGVAATGLDDALAEMTSTFNGEYGSLRQDASAAALLDGTVVGAVMVVKHSLWDADLDGPFIIDLFVHERAKGQGLGRALLTHAVAACSRADDRTLSLRFGEGTSPQAMTLYHRLGFAPA